ncbi:MAG: SpoIIE family protein phosphatase, partial [Bacteroidaceae bacterium]|nr:SpoIIE family protein phosphatase [Bacteroidaceae bacterium]
SLPLYDLDGEMYAVFTADISLEWFADKVNEIKLYPNSFNYMIGRGGTFLVSDRKEAILNESYFARPLLEGDEGMLETGHRMINGENGMSTFERDGEEYYMFFAPVKSTGWSVCVACLYSDVFAAVDGMRNMMIALSLIGLLLLAWVCYLTIRKLTAPLSRFAESATEIAQGNFMATLPDIHSKDEMKTLHQSFGYMQKSLVDYIDELKRTTASKERIESELRIARDIQMGMVPKIFPPFPERDDVDLYAKLIPAKEVGGDLYDFFIEGGKFYFIVGDVSGKGVPASLVMAVTCRLFRTVSAHFQTPAEIVTALNDALAESNESNMFCTFFIGILDLESGYLQYCNAGHNAPVILSPSGEVKFMEVEANLPLGLYGGFPYQGQECTIEKDTSIFLYTDGVTEAENVEKALYSDERLLQQLEKLQKETPNAMVDGVLVDIESHVAEAEQSDDITIMCLHYK